MCWGWEVEWWRALGKWEVTEKSLEEAVQDAVYKEWWNRKTAENRAQDRQAWNAKLKKSLEEEKQLEEEGKLGRAWREPWRKGLWQ